MNECETKAARCHENQECINTVGSYRCAVKCGAGFRRASGGLSCQGKLLRKNILRFDISFKGIVDFQNDKYDFCEANG